MIINTVERLPTTKTALASQTERICENCGETFYQNAFARYCRICRPIVIRKHNKKSNKKRRQLHR